jgi:ribonuclease HI
LILYSDGSKNEENGNLGAGIAYSTDKRHYNSNSWNIGKFAEVFNAEVYAILQAFKLAKTFSLDSSLKEIWIFSDSQAALKRLQKSSISSEQANLESILSLADYITKKSVKIHLHLVPAHMGIKGNEFADIAAKKGTEFPENKRTISWPYLKRIVKESCLEEWQDFWEKNKAGRSYFQFNTIPKWTYHKVRLKKALSSTIIQLKLGHGYFRTYLARLPDYNSDSCISCFGNLLESPEHLLLHCSKNQSLRNSLKEKYKQDLLTMPFLFTTTLGMEILKEFLIKTKIATRKWLLET